MKTSFYNKIEEIKKNTFKTNQISKLNPPRKKLSSINKNQDTTGIKHNSKSGNEISSLYETDLNYNFEKDSGFEDIFDDIGNMRFKMNNYTQYGKDIKKDNYIYLEKIKLFGKLKKSLLPLDKKEFNKYKYIYTEIENNGIKKSKKINLTKIDQIKKGYYSSDDIKIKNKNLKILNYSDIRNKGTKKLSKFSKLFGEESILTGNEKFLQAGNNLNNNNEGDNYEKNLKDNNNQNDISNISYKKISEKSSRKINLYKKNYNNLMNSSYSSNERQKLKNSLNASINSKNKFLSKNKYQEFTKDQNLENQLNNKENLYNKKNILSSSEIEMINSPDMAEKKKNCFFYYLEYFAKREIFLTTFYNKYKNISSFIRLSTFFFVIGFIFMLSCFILNEDEIQKRYENYNSNNKINEFGYSFKYNIKQCLVVAIISIIFKMICIKIVYFVLFKISHKTKEEFSSSIQNNLNQTEIQEIANKKKIFIKNYQIKAIVFFIIIFILLFVLAYTSVSFIGTFPKIFIGILINFFISIIISFIFCAFLCFIISIFHWCGCFSIFNVLKIIY